MDDARLQAYEPAPGAHAYTAFMAWLALYGSEAEVAAGFLVNFAAWGANCGRMGRALRDRYGLTQETTAFFDLFAAPSAEFESQAMAVVANGLARGADSRLVKRAARLLQGYEKLYWDTLHALLGARRAFGRPSPPIVLAKDPGEIDDPPRTRGCVGVRPLAWPPNLSRCGIRSRVVEARTPEPEVTKQIGRESDRPRQWVAIADLC